MIVWNERNIGSNQVRVAFSSLAISLVIVAALTLVSALLPHSIFAAPGINQTINFQGRLLGKDGNTAANGSYSVTFSLYTINSGGANIWTETQSVTTSQGLFRVALGAVNSLSAVDFNQDNLYLGIKVGADAEMSPRIRFAASPQAFNAQKVNGYSVSGALGGLAFFGNNALTSDANLFWDITAKRLGIGNSNPSVALDVTGAITASGAINGSTVTSGGRILAKASIDIDPTTSGGWARALQIYNNNIKHMTFGALGSGDTLTYGYIGAEFNNTIVRFYADKRASFDGQIGIGTTSPEADLHIKKTSGGGSLIIESTDATTARYASLRLKHSTANWTLDTYSDGALSISDNRNARSPLVISTAGKIGIGDAAPVGNAALDVNGMIRVRNPQGEITAPTRAQNGEFAFASPTAGTGRLYFRSNGTNYYIGTTATGDYSEYFLKQNNLEVFTTGTVVTLDSGRVASASTNNSVLGIVSAFGTRNNDDNEDGMRHTDPRYVNVGLLGQLPVLVTSENGAIIPGDNLSVSSVLDGAGAKAQSSAGFARALESFIPTPDCPTITSLSDIQWPAEIRNENTAHGLCWRLPDGTFIGRIAAYIASSSANAGISTPTSNETLDALLAELSFESGSAVLANNLFVEGKITANTGLAVNGPAEFNGPTFFKALAEFIDKAIFRNDVRFERKVEFTNNPTFSKDTAGTALIGVGQSSVRINFTQPLERNPVVSTTLNSGPLLTENYQAYLNQGICTFEQGPAGCEKALKAQLLSTNIRFVISDQSTTGFTVELESPAPQDLRFSWTAIQVQE